MQGARRRQQQRSASTTARLRHATVALICERGYANITTAEIAARAEVSRGALLHHYPLKIDLIVDAAASVWRDAAREVRALAGKLRNGTGDIDAVVDRMWATVFREDAVKMTIDLMSASQADARLRDRLEPHLRRLFDSYGEIAEQAFAGAGLTARERQTLVSYTTCVMRGLRMQNIMAPSPEMTGAVLDELKAHLRRGLAGARPMPGTLVVGRFGEAAG